MHPEIKQLKNALGLLYARNKTSVSFIDESYRDGSSKNEYAFYTVTATVISAEQVVRSRIDYTSLVGN